MEKERESNIELLRLVLMTMIVLWHFIVHGVGIITDCSISDLSVYKSQILAMPFLCYHVPCFIFISGYYGIKISKIKVVSFLWQASVYSVSIYILSKILFFDCHLGRIPNFVDSFFPISNNKYWFFTDYFYLMLLSPIINIGVEKLSQRTFMYLLIVLSVISISGISFVLNGGDGLGLFLFMYILGRYFRIYPLKFLSSLRNVTALFVGSIIMNFFIFALMVLGVINLGTGNIYHYSGYNNPIVIVSAVLFFFVFKNISLTKSKILNFLASGVFGVYLLTDSPEFRMPFDKGVISIFGPNILVLVGVSIATVIIISFFESFRRRLDKPIVESIVNKINAVINR